MSSRSAAKSFQATVVRLVRAHLGYITVFSVAIIIFDAWNLITTEVILERWIIAAVMAFVTSAIWYASRQRSNSSLYYKILIIGFIVLDLYVATYSVYAQRGIASRSVFLFVIPIIVSALLMSRAAIFATATIASAAYVLVSVRYFYLNPGQAYKVELYGELAYYIGMFYVVAAMLWVVAYSQLKSKD